MNSEAILDRWARTAPGNQVILKVSHKMRTSSEETVEELADTDQAYEAGILEGVEDADDHPERPVHTHEDQGKTEDVPPKPV